MRSNKSGPIGPAPERAEPTEPVDTGAISGIGAFLLLVGVLGLFVPVDPWVGKTARLIALGANGSLATLLYSTPRRWVLSLIVGRTLVTVGAQVYRALHARGNLGGWVLWTIVLLMNVLILFGCGKLLRARVRS